MGSVRRGLIVEKRIKLFFFLVALLLVFLTITQVQNMLISTLFAVVTYNLLAPVVDFFERRGLSRTLATVLPFAFMTAGVVVAVVVLLPSLLDQLRSLQAHFPQYQKSALDLLHQLEEKLGQTVGNGTTLPIQARIEGQFSHLAEVVFQQAPEYVSSSLAILFLAPFLSFFMLLNGRDFLRGLLSIVPNQYFELSQNLTHQITSQIGGFIRARLIESIIVGLLTWAGLEYLEFPNALVLAIFAAIVNIIPYLGPVLGFLPVLLIGFSGGGYSSELLWAGALFLAVQVIDAVILVPFLVAKIVDLHPVVVILAILVGSQLMGIVGMIICIPVVASLKVTAAALFRHFTGFRSSQDLII